jgi:hypothetical protein
MEVRKSSVSSISPAQRKAVREAYQANRTQQILLAAPDEALLGVPGDQDQRKFLTDHFENMVALQTRNTGTIGYHTNPEQWRDYDPGRFDGLLAPPGEYDARPYYYSDLNADPFIEKTADHVVTPSRPVTYQRATALPFSVNIVQEAGKTR